MSEFNISIPGGESRRLLTGGKYCPADILVTAEGRAPVVEKDVNFYDYDGTLLYSYTLAEAQALTELPPLPDWHKRLIPYGWNWTLDEVTSLDYRADIGALYDTEDHATYIGLDIIEPKNASVTLRFSGNADIDWGDGTTSSGVTAPVVHSYPSVGKYEIKLSGCTSIGGGATYNQVVSGNGRKNVVYIYHDASVGITDYCFFQLRSLERISLRHSPKPHMLDSCSRLRYFADSVGEFHIGQFRDCYSLEFVSSKKNIGYIHGEAFRTCASLKRIPKAEFKVLDGTHHFYNCHSVDELHYYSNCPAYGGYTCLCARKITIHEGVKSVDQNAFYNCQSAEVISIGSTVESIAAQAFQGCLGAAVIKFLPITPPTVANANAFTQIASPCVVEVPAESLEAYKNATNYASISALMVGV